MWNAVNARLVRNPLSLWN